MSRITMISTTALSPAAQNQRSKREAEWIKVLEWYFKSLENVIFTVLVNPIMLFFISRRPRKENISRISDEDESQHVFHRRASFIDA